MENYFVKPYLFKDLKYPFVLPLLGYSYDALEPYFDARTMEIHHAKHHQVYVDSLNAALAPHTMFHGHTLEELLINLDKLPDAIRMAVQNHGGGHKNHSLFWQLLATGGADMPSGDLAKKVETAFGGYDIFKEKFTTAAKARFGSGWAWLSLNMQDDLVVTSTLNQNSPVSEGLRPFMGLDVWEHAYYLKYQNRRVDYIDAWWHVLDWNKVEPLYKKALNRG